MSIITSEREVESPRPSRGLARSRTALRRTARSPSPPSRVDAACQDLARGHRVGATIGVAALLAALVVAFGWFRTGTFYAVGDPRPWIRDSLRSEIGWQWTHQNSGAGGPTYELVRVRGLGVIDIAHLLGGTDSAGRAAVLRGHLRVRGGRRIAFFASRFVRRPSLVVVAGLLAAFNPFLMVNMSIILLPLTIGMVGLFGGLTLDAAGGPPRSVPRVRRRDTGRPRTWRSTRRSWRSSACGSSVMPFVAPMLTGTGWAGSRRVIAFLGRAIAWSVPLAAWWLVPVRRHDHTRVDSGTIVANTDVNSWVWTHAVGSFDRVLALMAKWGWPAADPGDHASFLGTSGWVWLAVRVADGRDARATRAPAADIATLWLLMGVLLLGALARG